MFSMRASFLYGFRNILHPLIFDVIILQRMRLPTIVHRARDLGYPVLMTQHSSRGSFFCTCFPSPGIALSCLNPRVRTSLSAGQNDAQGASDRQSRITKILGEKMGGPPPL
jgi:hypothetical protein